MDATEVPESPPPVARKKRRGSNKQAPAACNRCRRSKKRCDNVRPNCGECLRANAACVYDTIDSKETRSQAIRRRHNDLQATHNTLNDSLLWLSSLSPDNALTCLQRVRDTQDPIAELCALAPTERAQHPSPARPSTSAVLMAASHTSPASSHLDLSLTYPISYPQMAGKPAELSDEDQTDLSRSWPGPNLPSFNAILSHESSLSPEGVGSGLMYAPPKLFDVRLYNLKIGYWTIVDISNELAAIIISAYLEVEHPVYNFFDADLFLRDLIGQNVHFCSPLLVNALLFWACCTFGPMYPEASAFAERFLHASQQLLRAERNLASPLAVAALMILTIGSIGCGGGELAKHYMAAGISMAEDLHLIGEDRYRLEQFEDTSHNELESIMAVAWGCFCFSMQVSQMSAVTVADPDRVYTMHFHDLYSGTFAKRPPLLPRPGFRALVDEMLDADETPCATSARVGASFPFVCKFWCIAHEVATLYYATSGPIFKHIPLAFAESKYHNLLQWAEALPPELARSEDMAHNIAAMHICYHATIMDVFRPFLAQKQFLSMFSADPRRPEAVFSLSLSHLRGLTVDYQLFFAYRAESCTFSAVRGPLYLASAILHHDEKGSSQKSEFISCMSRCSSLVQSHGVMKNFFKGLFAMAVDSETLTIAEAKSLFCAMCTVRVGEPCTFEHPESCFILDQDLAMEKRAEAAGNVLAAKFDNMSILEDIAQHEIFDDNHDAEPRC